MSTAAVLLTVDEFLQLPESETVRRELCEGVVIELSFALSRHEIVKSDINAAVTVWAVGSGRGKVFSETLFVLSSTDAFMPDVAWLSAERLAAADRRQQFQGAPDLAVEVVSSETAAQLEKKIEGYFRHGSRAVWVAYPEQRAVRVHRPDGSARLLEGDQVLEDSELLPGFRVAVSAFFEGL